MRLRRFEPEITPVRSSATPAMMLVVVVLFLTSAAPGIAATGKVVGGQVSEHPDWFKESFLDIGEDVAEAAETDRHVMLFLHLNGCPYCYKMVEENLKHAPYTDFIREHFDVIALNIRGDREVALNETTSLTEKALASRLKVVYTPTVIFLNSDNQPVARVNGYRSAEEFKYVLDYVANKAYESQTLSAFVDAQKTERYRFRDHPQLVETDDLSAYADRPLAVLFEDQGCVACDALHDGHLAAAEIREILNEFAFVRVDALSDAPIIGVDGAKTTGRDFAASLELTHRPGLVLFDRGREIMRIESELYRYHFTEILRYVGDRLYEYFPDSFYDYLDVRTAELTASGQDVDLGPVAGGQ